MRLLVWLTGWGCCIVWLGGMSLAQHMTPDVRRVIVERQEIMKNTGANFKDAQQKMRV